MPDVVRFSSYQQVQRYFLFAAATNGVLYGAFLVLAGATIVRLNGIKTLAAKTFSRMTKFAVAMCLVATLFTVSLNVQTYRILFPEHSPLWTKIPVAVMFCSITLASSLGDLLFIYRTWIIWERSRLVIFPLVLFCADLVVMLAANIRIAKDGNLSNLMFTAVTERLAISGMIIGLVLNALLSLAAIGRLLLARHHLRRDALPAGGSHYIKISRLLALTGLIYTAAWLTMLITRRSIGATIALVAVFEVVCICPLVILLHVAGRTQADTLHLPEVAMTSSVHIVAVELGAAGDDARLSVASAERMPTFKTDEEAGHIDPRPGVLWYQSSELAEDEDIVLHCRRLSEED
ncbi:hypothetical protein AURDEDRAFT_156005 [Auricularia subglabra TFB-10046 SS5]|nr:hypothetical protein AURDEDRAFT_156005 [Auricularia subglabra TFB-10046 SS5]